MEFPDTYSKMSDDDLADNLRRKLKERRYLIFLDDVWDIGAWNNLEMSFPDDNNGSRIILTSRILDVAPQVRLDEKPLVLRQLTNDESWELLRKKLFPGNDCTQGVSELGMQIAENCKGLPLTIIIVAGILATMKKDCWNEVLDSLSSGNISRMEQCWNTLELSYKHLPEHLKPCLLYFGAFPEDGEIPVKRLVQLWIAEGFIQNTESNSLEDVARHYMMDLIGRSLVMVAKQRSIGGVKSCRVHDLLQQFCLAKAKQKSFFHVINGDELNAFNEPGYLWRLCIHSNPHQFMESMLFYPRLRSLLYFTSSSDCADYDVSFICWIFKLLRVIDIRELNSGSSFLNEVELLVQLKYLAVQAWVSEIPPSIGNLLNLETCILDVEPGYVSLPHTIWNLKNLRHLCLSKGSYFRFTGLGENLVDSSTLYELDSCSGALIHSWNTMEKQLRKVPNIRKLRCKIFENIDDIESCKEIRVPDFMSRLESLHLSTTFRMPDHIELRFPRNLRKLTLSYLNLGWSHISGIGKLPNLEVLKLLRLRVGEEIWEVKEGEFPKLTLLKLVELDVVEWRAESDDPFPSLEKLVVEQCYDLKEIPSWLMDIPTLEMIEIQNCSTSTTELLEQIRKNRLSMGFSEPKIMIGDTSLRWRR